MLLGLYIIVDDEFDAPVYADRAADEQDETAWSLACECVNDALEGEGPARGVREHQEIVFAWRTQRKVGVSLISFASGIKGRELAEYLRMIYARYADEVEDLRDPDRNGIEDVIVDVIPPWDD